MVFKISLSPFQSFELKGLIPTYGETAEEVARFIITDWLFHNSSRANEHNLHVIDLIDKKKRKK